VRRCINIKVQFGIVKTYSVMEFLDGSHLFGTSSVSQGLELITLCPYITGRIAWSVVMTPVGLLASPIGYEGRPFLRFLGLLSMQQRDSVSLMLRLRVFGRSSAGRMIVGGDVQDMLVFLMVDEVIF
jgi:hypothetical protein